jgi:hypothetical protein
VFAPFCRFVSPKLRSSSIDDDVFRSSTNLENDFLLLWGWMRILQTDLDYLPSAAVSLRRGSANNCIRRPADPLASMVERVHGTSSRTSCGGSNKKDEAKQTGQITL